MVFRGLMLMLDRAGYIELPARRKSPLNSLVPRKKPAPWFFDLHPLQGPLSSILLLAIRLVRLVLRTVLQTLCDSLIEQYHYLGYCRRAGEHLKYLVFAQSKASSPDDL
jgi:hypothetical protein